MLFSNKKILLIVPTVFLLMIIILLMVISLNKPLPQNEVPPSPTPTVTPSPTPTPRPDQFSVKQSLPSQNPTATYLPLQKITVVFSEPVRPNLVKFDVSPSTDIELKQGENPNTVLIFPLTKWEIGETTVTILPSTRSTTGKTLYAPYFHKFFIDIPEAPELKYNPD